MSKSKINKWRNGVGSHLIKTDGAVVIKLGEVIQRTEGMNKYRLSKMTGIRYDTICNYCNGKVSLINKEYIKIFCSILNCNVEDIMEYKKEE